MKALISILLFASSSYAQTQARPEICSRPDTRAYRTMASLDQGTFAAWWPEFMEWTHNGRTERWAAIMGSREPTVIRGWGNRFVDLSDRRAGRIRRAPGFFDGQWTKDRESEPLFTVPNKWAEEKGGIQPGLTFYRHSEVLADRNTAPIFHDPSFGNHYHSFGVVGKGVDAQGRRYVDHRAMNDKWGATIRDYRAYLDASGKTVSMEPLGPETNLTNGPDDVRRPKVTAPGEPVMADPNFHASYYDLPMISPDGRFFAVNNRRTMTAQVFEILPNGQKRLLTDLGFETGKISFAPQKPGSNELRLAFHVDQIDPAEGDKMTSLHGGMTKDVVVLNLAVGTNAQGQTTLERKGAIRVTSSEEAGTGNYYPKWINDHEIIYLHGDQNFQQSFIKVDIDRLQEEEIALEAVGLGDCEDCVKDTNLAAVVALGKMFADACTNISDQISAREAQLYTMQLTPESCRRLSQTWEQNKDRVLSTDSLFTLRAPKRPGHQRRSDPAPVDSEDQRPRTYNFPESYSSRGARRSERAAKREEIRQITQSDLEAVCARLKPE